MLNINKKSKSLAIAILIGGKSSRFGTDKGLYPLHGKPLLSYQLEILSQFNHDIFLVAHSKQQIQKYIDTIDIKKITAIIIDDNKSVSRFKERSPIIGLYSAFKELNVIGYEKALILPCDLPMIQQKVVELLISQCEKFDCCIPQWDNGLLEPLLAIYPIQKALISTKNNLKRKNFRLVAIIEQSWNINYISIENSIQPLDHNLLSFVNINSQEDLVRVLKME